MKSEIRNPKSERSPKPEIRNPKGQPRRVARGEFGNRMALFTPAVWFREKLKHGSPNGCPPFRDSDFGLRTSFGFRISDFGFVPMPCAAARRRQ